MGRKIEFQEIVNEILIFFKQFLRPRQSVAHDTCHACHTLDTPLAMTISLFADMKLKLHKNQVHLFWCRFSACDC